MNTSSILNGVPFCKGTEQCSSDIRWQNKVTGKSWWRKAVSGQAAIYTKGALTREIFVLCISDQDAEKALNTTAFHSSMCVCAHVARLEVGNMQIRNPPMMHRRPGKKQRQSPSSPACAVVLFAHQLLLSKCRRLYGLHTKQTTHGSGNSARGKAVVTHGYLAVRRKKSGERPLAGRCWQAKMKEQSNAESAVDDITHIGKEKEEKERKRKIWLRLQNAGKISI